MKPDNKGFTLIELMVTVSIIGILAAIAYPSYTSHIRKSRRVDAQAALLGFANAMERRFTETNTYCNLGGAGGSNTCGDTDTTNDTGPPSIYSAQSPIDGGTAFYTLTITTAANTTYVLRATPVNAQAGDGILELTQDGVRRWDKNGDTNIATTENTWD
jgi:type IV pilus assembly protein PilE